MKKTLKIIGISILILILFRGIIYRLAINYSEIGNRQEIKVTNKKLIDKIVKKSKDRKIDLREIAEIADEITKSELEFTTNRASNNPNELIDANQANCIGYSAMFNSIANYLIRKNGLQNEIEAEHKIGELDLFGINLHQFFDSPFFRDHDFNEITNQKTGEKIFIDPSVSDYLRINRITKND
ncbi:MAG TPA: hypothetical protein ENK75_04175 [Saprospiraceae bacterium]|nr:hypothetical protein [Saprospiraceae bacterium]HHH52231.1 hypothetical protein [Bacteroidota bacterium]